MSAGSKEVQLLKQHGLSLMSLSFQQRKENFLKRCEDITRLKVVVVYDATGTMWLALQTSEPLHFTSSGCATLAHTIS